MKNVRPGWWLIGVLALCFTLATVFVPRAMWWNAVPRAADWDKAQSQSDNVFKLMLGEGRRLFANEMFDMADAYFHSGYYPSIFDQPVAAHDVAEPAHGQAEDEDSTSDDFFGPPPDWIAALDRQFVPDRHTHLDAGGPTGHEKALSVQEILPWLKLATDMNPQMIDSYTVGAYWLRRLHKPDQALDFLFDGLRNNPGNSELLYDIGSLYDEDFHDSGRARNTWLAALRCWQAHHDLTNANLVDKRIYGNIAMALAHQAQDAGDWPQAAQYLKMDKAVSPYPDAIQKQIDEAEQKMRSGK